MTEMYVKCIGDKPYAYMYEETVDAREKERSGAMTHEEEER